MCPKKIVNYKRVVYVVARFGKQGKEGEKDEDLEKKAIQKQVAVSVDGRSNILRRDRTEGLCRVNSWYNGNNADGRMWLGNRTRRDWGRAV